MEQTFSAILTNEEGMYVAKCSEVGTVSQGKTIEEAIENLREATELYLEEFPIKKREKPIMSFFTISSNGGIQKNIG